MTSRPAAVSDDAGVCSLKDLAAFIQEVDTELAKPLIGGDYEALVNVIGILYRMKDRQSATDEMFEPLKQAIELLKIYNQELPDEVHQHLQVCADCCRNINVQSKAKDSTTTRVFFQAALELN